jgi:hypothetical protein
MSWDLFVAPRYKYHISSNFTDAERHQITSAIRELDILTDGRASITERYRDYIEGRAVAIMRSDLPGQTAGIARQKAGIIVIDPQYQGRLLAVITLHEILHSMGIEHQASGLMAPEHTPDYDLTDDDRDMIRRVTARKWWEVF